MAHAELETFIFGKGSNHQRVDEDQEIPVGEMTAKVSNKASWTDVEISGTGLHYLIRRGDMGKVIVSGSSQEGTIRAFLERESIEVSDTSNRIKVTRTE